MRIGVDIRVLMDKYYSGVSEYAANLLKAILTLDKSESSNSHKQELNTGHESEPNTGHESELKTANEYKLFYNSFKNLDDKLKSWNRTNARVIGTHIPNKIFNYFCQKIFQYPKIDQVLGGVDIFWSPHFNFTSLSKSNSNLKKIITVHDLSFLRYPKFFSVRKNFWHRALNVKQTLLSADMLIAVSENTKNDIIELSGLAEDKIKVIYPGNNLIKREVGFVEKQEFLFEHKLSGRLILYLGNIEPRKNIVGLILAFNHLREEDLKMEGVLQDVKLVLAGASGWKNKKIYQAYENSPFKNDIKFLGYISKKEQEILYSLSSVFAYPSYYEGFGFPPLEAMTYGLPVVCSNISSLSEVVGEAALMINPNSIEEISGALKIILSDEVVRQRLIKLGYERTKLFSWDKAAREYLQVFKDVYEK